MKNLELWDRVEKTPKDIIVELEQSDGKTLKSVPSINRLKKATEEFGIYGVSWGLKDIKHSEVKIFNNLILATIECKFFVDTQHIKTEFEITNSTYIVMMQDKEFKVNVSYRKSLETDTINKALSRLGFFADIYIDDEDMLIGSTKEQDWENIDFVDIGVKDDNQ